MIKQFFRYIFNKIEDYLLTPRLRKDIIYTTKDVKVNDSKDTATTIEGNNYIIYEEQ